MEKREKPKKKRERGVVRGGEAVGSVRGRKKGGGWGNSWEEENK